MGRRIGEAVAKRLGRALLELGGNNAIIADESADTDLALRAILFGAVDTEAERSTAEIFCAGSEQDLWQSVRDLRDHHLRALYRSLL